MCVWGRVCVCVCVCVCVRGRVCGCVCMYVGGRATFFCVVMKQSANLQLSHKQGYQHGYYGNQHGYYGNQHGYMLHIATD